MKKNNNEELNNDPQSFVQEESDDESLVLKGPIISYGADYTLDSIRQYVNDSKQIVVQPSFQRKFVWDIKKASKLIESFILGYPVPNILLGRDPETEIMEVIDGQQRILSICDFFRGRFRDERIFKLTGDDIAPNFIGKTFDDLPEQIQNKLRNAVLKVIVLVYPKDDPNIKFTAFQRINTGSVVLNQQEIRNCIYGGPLNDLLFKLNEDDTWRKLVARKADKRMKDAETILRFFAAYFKGNDYEKPITKFLNDFMNQNRNLSDEKVREWENLFKITLDICVKNIGSLFPRTSDSKVFNRAVFESVMAAVARLKAKNTLNQRTLKAKYENLVQIDSYKMSVASQTSDTKKYKERIKYAIETLS